MSYSLQQHGPVAIHAPLPSIISWSWLEFMSIELVMLSNYLILCHLLILPSVFASIRVFSNDSALRIWWPKHWSFRFSISPSNEYSGLISFRIDWLDSLVDQGTLTSLVQHHSLKASILWCSAFFMVQLSHQYMTTRKTIALTIQTSWAVHLFQMSLIQTIYRPLLLFWVFKLICSCIFRAKFFR